MIVQTGSPQQVDLDATGVFDSQAVTNQGIRLCQQGDWERGLMYLQRVLELHPNKRQLPGQFFAYLGYGMMRYQRKMKEGLQLCRYGAKVQFYDPEIQYNLARAELLAEHRKEAIKAVQVGLRLDHGHKGLNELRESLGVRMPPVLSFLPRQNLLNRLLGRVRTSWTQRKAGT